MPMILIKKTFSRGPFDVGLYPKSKISMNLSRFVHELTYQTNNISNIKSSYSEIDEHNH